MMAEKADTMVPTIEAKSGLDMSSYQDLPKPDCNGISHHNQADDLDDSYVIVNGTDGLINDAVDSKNVVADVLSIPSKSKTTVEDQEAESDAQVEKLSGLSEEVSDPLNVDSKNVVADGLCSPSKSKTTLEDQEAESDARVEKVGDVNEDVSDPLNVDGKNAVADGSSIPSKSMTTAEDQEAESDAQIEKLGDVNEDVCDPLNVDGKNVVADGSSVPSKSMSAIEDQEAVPDGLSIPFKSMTTFEDQEAESDAQIEKLGDVNEEVCDPLSVDGKSVVADGSSVPSKSVTAIEDQEAVPGGVNEKVSEPRNEGENENIEGNNENLPSMNSSTSKQESSLDGEEVHASLDSGAEVTNNSTANFCVEVEPGVHDSCAIKFGEITTNVTFTCKTEVLDGFEAKSKGASNIVQEIEEAKHIQNQLDGIASSGDKDLLLQENEATGNSHSNNEFIGSVDSSSADVIDREEGSSEAVTKPFNSLQEMTSDATITCRIVVSDNFDVKSESASNKAETDGDKDVGNLLNGMTRNSNENLFLQENEATGNSQSSNISICSAGDSSADVIDREAASAETVTKPFDSFPEVASDATVTSKTELLDSTDFGSEGPSNNAPETDEDKDVGNQLNSVTRSSNENLFLQENEATGNSQSSNISIGLAGDSSGDVINREVAITETVTKPFDSFPEVASDATVASRTVGLDSIDVKSECASNNVPEAVDVKYTGNQLNGNARSGDEKLFMPEDEANGNSQGNNLSTGSGECSILNVTDQEEACNEAVTKSSNFLQEMTSDVAFPCRIEVLDSSDVQSKGVQNNVPETDYVQHTRSQLDVIARSGDANFFSQQNEETGNFHGSNMSMGSAKGSCAEVTNIEESSTVAVKKPFNFLVRVPRFNDEILKEQIRLAKLNLDEKEKLRDAIQRQIQEKRANNQNHGVDYEYAKGEDRRARKLVRSKRMEIDSLQSMISKANSAVSIEDIDRQIYNMEHKIQHETLPLKEEKQLIREIKQLKQLREQLSSNMGKQDEIKQALEQKEEVEERLKIVRKELDILKGGVIKAEAAAADAEKKYDEENKKIKELQAQFKDADDVRQEAYAQWQNLKKELWMKNKQFFRYKDDSAAASNYAFSRDQEALSRLCMDQVEKLMELWNTSDEFRREYVKSNARSTVRRLGTFDGRSLGPDEQPPIFPSYGHKRVDRTMVTPAKVDSVSKIPAPEQNHETSVENVISVGKLKTLTESKNQKATKKIPSEPALGNGLGTVSSRDVRDDMREDEPKKSLEEIELERKAEALRREEEEAKLKEINRLEMLAKAKEALERKKRQAEKAQKRAELRAQKQAEQKEKEREKRLRKKERKAAAATDVNDVDNNCGNSPSIESSIDVKSQDIEFRDMPPLVETKKPPQKPWLFTNKSKTRSVPPPLRNRNKKNYQQWMWAGFICVVFFVLFWLGNIAPVSQLNF